MAELEKEKERTTIELLKRPDVVILRSLKASLTLQFNAEVSNRDVILYLFVTYVLGTKTADSLVSTVQYASYNGDFSRAVEKVADILLIHPDSRKEKMIPYEHEASMYYDDWKEVSETEKDLAEVKKDEKEYYEAYDKLMKVKLPWK